MMFGLVETTQEWKDVLEAWEGIQDRPPKEYRRRPQGFRVLKNGFLEKWIATSHWVMPGVWFIPLCIFCVYLSVTSGLTNSTTVTLFVIGALGWSLVEYILHRWVFHLPKAKNIHLREIQYVLHGYHHEFPDDPGRLVAPPALSWPIGLILAAIYWTVLGSYAPAAFAGTLVGYLAYDWVHYYTHHAVPKSRAGKFMRRFHLEHHFKTANSQYGLSSPLWDWVFGTFWTTSAFGTQPTREQEFEDEGS